MKNPKSLATISLFLLLCGACTREAAPVQAPVVAAPVVAAQSAAPAAPVVAAAPAAPAVAVLASADGDQPGTRVELLELKRSSGDTVTARFTIVLGPSTNIRFSSFLGTDPDPSSVNAVHLTDPVAKKEYLAIMNSNRECLCSRGLDTLTPGRTNLWAKFPAPPAGVEKVSVVIPHFGPLDDIRLAN